MQELRVTLWQYVLLEVLHLPSAQETITEIAILPIVQEAGEP
jgi:hypothetical protein